MNHQITIKFPSESLHGKTIRFEIATDKKAGGQCVVNSGIGKLIVGRTEEEGKYRVHISVVEWDGQPGLIKVSDICLTQRTADLIRICPDGMLECIDPLVSDTR